MEKLFNQKSINALSKKIGSFDVEKDLDSTNIEPFFLVILKKYTFN